MARNKSRYETQNGRLVAIDAPEDTHGTVGGYRNWGCRCVPCSTAGSQRSLLDRAKRFEKRIEIGGRLIAIEAPTHGTSSTYVNWGCHCELCTYAHGKYQHERRNKGLKELRGS